MTSFGESEVEAFMKQGAIFDMDGLMFDTERLWQEGWRILAERYG